ncbi:NAD(P)/FAD-dependent oxidoreductase [Hoeflea sp. Naph1]|uniref:NAD(P)/FAD-dependent oxidoreductase n=2 Tax=unclassified Hoeflea TaxID=2614931 RepID=UPI00398FA5A9
MLQRLKGGEPLSVAIVGAGIVGCATALALALDGHQVTLFDPDAPGAGTSSGNAGGIVTGSVTPTATPEVLRALPSYLFDKSSPAVLRLRHSLKVLPWLFRFARAGLPNEMNRIAAALHPILSGSLSAHGALAAHAGAQAMITQEGWLKVFASEQAFAATAQDRRLMDRFGVNYTILDHKAVTDLEPNLNPDLCAVGFYQPDCGFVRNPKGLAQAYFDAAARLGAIHLRQRVDGVARRNEGGVTVHAEGVTHRFDRLVVAAGAWSASLVKQLGDKVSLDTERGYHISFGPETAGLLRGPLVLPGMSMVLSPMHDGLRLVSGDELAGLAAPPNYSRIRALIPAARRAVPALRDVSPRSEWMGFRPSTPDSLPVIGPSPQGNDVIYAFGHGHLGLTLSAITAQMVADTVAARALLVDPTPYLISRF